MTLESAFIYNNKHITDEYFERVTRFQKVEGTTEIMLKILQRPMTSKNDIMNSVNQENQHHPKNPKRLLK